MIMDQALVFSDAQAVTVTANSTNVEDLSSTANIGRGQPIRARAQVHTSFTAAGAATLQAQFVESAAANLGSPNVLFDTGAVGKATLVAGYIMADIFVPRTSLQYVGWIYTVATGPMTAGAIDAMLVEDTETRIADRVVGNTGL